MSMIILCRQVHSLRRQNSTTITQKKISSLQCQILCPDTRFSGWTVKSPSGSTINADGTFTIPNDDVVLVGSWMKIEDPWRQCLGQHRQRYHRILVLSHSGKSQLSRPPRRFSIIWRFRRRPISVSTSPRVSSMRLGPRSMFLAIREGYFPLLLLRINQDKILIRDRKLYEPI